jgi:hypothetical protein
MIFDDNVASQITAGNAAWPFRSASRFALVVPASMGLQKAGVDDRRIWVREHQFADGILTSGGTRPI